MRGTPEVYPWLALAFAIFAIFNGYLIAAPLAIAGIALDLHRKAPPRGTTPT